MLFFRFLTADIYKFLSAIFFYFKNQLDIFQHQLVIQYFKYSLRIVCLDYLYTDWIVDFQRRHRGYDLVNSTSRSLVTSYLESQAVQNKDEEERFFYLLQFFLSVY